MTKPQSDNSTQAKASMTGKRTPMIIWEIPATRARRGFVWWCTTLCIMLLGLILLIGFQDWWALPVGLLIAGIILFFNLTSSTAQRISLNAERIEVVYLGSKGRIDTVRLTDFNAFTTVSIGGTQHNPERWLLVFRPKKRLAGSASVTLPQDPELAVKIARRIESSLDYIEDGSFRNTEQILARLYAGVGLR